MSNIVRKSGQIIWKSSPPTVVLLLFMGIWGAGFIVGPIFMIISMLKNVDSLDVFCKKIEPRLIDCQLTTTPKISIFSPTTVNYANIKGVQYLTEERTEKDSDGDTVTYTVYYVVFKQISGNNQVEFDDRAGWVVSQINQFLNSEQETLSVANSDPDAGLLVLLFPVAFILIGVAVVSSTVYLESIDINNNFRQIIRTRIGLPFYKKTIGFGDVGGVGITEHTDDEGDKSFTLEIHYRSGPKQQKIFLMRTTNQAEVSSLGEEICKLTGFPMLKP